MDDIEKIKKQLEEYKSLRSKLASVREEAVEETPDVRKSFKEEIEEIDAQISYFESELEETIQGYKESYEKLQQIIDEYEDAQEKTGLLTSEELQAAQDRYESFKLTENESSLEILKRFERQEKIIKELKSKRTRLEKDIDKAEALGLSYAEYKSMDTIRKGSIMNRILHEKGLESIIDKPQKDRTKEEKELLAQARQEILAEVSAFKEEHEDYSLLDTIEALYSLDTEYIEIKKPEEVKVPSKELMVIKENRQLVPVKIQNPNQQEVNYIPEEQPKDMESAMDNEKVDITELKPAEEKVTIYKDTNTNKYYVRKYAIDKFNLTQGNEEKIDGVPYYEISASDVEKIKENAKNDFIVDTKETQIEKEVVKEEIINNEEFIEEKLNNDVDPERIINNEEFIEEKLNNEVNPEKTFNNEEFIEEKLNNKVNPEKTFNNEENREEKLNNEVLPEETKDELIPGTIIKRPRDRGIYETDEEYEAFLKSYYDRVFAKATDAIENNNSNEKVTVFQDENNKSYVRKYVADRYKLATANKDKEVRINGSLCYEISDADVEKLQNEKDNDLSPYNVNIEKIKNPLADENEIKPNTEEKHLMVIDQVDKTTEPVVEEEIEDYNIVKDPENEIKPNTEEKHLMVIDQVDKTTEPVTEVVTEPVTEVETGPEISEDDIKTAIEEALNKDDEKTEDTDKDKENDGKLKPKNVKASNKFKRELKEGTLAYNIVHKVPKIIKKIFKKAIEKVGEFFEKAEEASQSAEDYLMPGAYGTKMYVDDLPRYLGR